MQLLDLAVAPYEPRETPTEGREEPRPSRSRSKKVKDLHRLREPLDRHGASALNLNVALDELERGGRQQDRPGIGQLFHSGCEVCRLTHGGVVHVEITPDRADHDFAGVQPYTDSYRDPV